MNKILVEVKRIIEESIKEYLPEVKPTDLEENGKVYYMNGKNGTEFEWYVNEHLPCFMVFYNDEQNMGVAKLSVYTDGGVELYLYGDHGNELVKEISTSIETSENDLFNLAVVLKKEADDARFWDGSIDNINSDRDATDTEIAEFEKTREYMEPTINRNKLLNKTAFVSKRVLEEGWKIGYMCREEALDERDSGWALMAGNEDEEYNSDPNNIALVTLYYATQLDPDIWDYIDSPEGSRFIRISSSEFEIDDETKEIFTEKRDDIE